MSIPFTDLVAALPASTPFVGPETLERQRGKVFSARIGANESAFGISPFALQAMQHAVTTSNWYADPESFELRAALAEKHAVRMDEICVDAGVDTLLGLAVRMLMSAKQNVVTSLGAYPTFNYHVAGFGGNLITVPYHGFHEDPEALLAAANRHQAPLVYFSNPDNPMGTWHNKQTVQRMIDAIPDKNCVLLLDEAYTEFADSDIAPDIDTSNPRVLRMRTFSKAYGMAGQRVGYVIAHRSLIAGFNKVRNHFGLNRVAQIGALASVQDTKFLTNVQRAVRAARSDVMQFANQRQLYAEPSYANFVALDLGSCERATAMISALAQRDVFMRMPAVAPLNRCIRVGLGNAQEYQLFRDAFDDAFVAN